MLVGISLYIILLDITSIEYLQAFACTGCRCCMNWWENEEVKNWQ